MPAVVRVNTHVAAHRRVSRALRVSLGSAAGRAGWAHTSEGELLATPRCRTSHLL